jgi:dihydroorotate dehydrogenase subfamily 2
MNMKLSIPVSHALYRGIFRPIFFRFDSEDIHVFFTDMGEKMGRSHFMTALMRSALRVDNPALVQTVDGIRFENPVGLAAGFDYRAQLSNVLPAIGFGFGTIGTITNQPYEGNPRPRLGRLVRSRSLLVNKGFKNSGIDDIIKKTAQFLLRRPRGGEDPRFKKFDRTFSFPVGLSLGKTNTHAAMAQDEAVADVVSAFKKAETSHIPFSYYELNISCPNLFGNVTFYPPENLRKLLAAVTELRLSRPLFIKMPIEKTDDETREMLRVITDFPVAGVIFGNLQKDRTDPSFVKKEIEHVGVGNFSGVPTRRRSDELIRLSYREYGKKLVIIGCGGIMNTEDAYRKIRLGATLVELITGLIYEGPQLAAAVNAGLVTLLKKDGLANISDAIGLDA